MTQFIILSSNEAGAVRGPSNGLPVLAALEPVALTDGRFILGVEVLADPMHAGHATFMGALPQADLTTIAPLLPVPVVVGTGGLGATIVGALAAAWNWVVGT